MKNPLSLILNTIKDSKEHFVNYSEVLVDMSVDNAVKILNIKDIYKKNRLKRNYATFIDAIREMNTDEIKLIVRC